MTVTTLALRRRTRVERRVLAILRGEEHATVAVGHAHCFARLRRLGERHGLAILPPGTRYIGEEELTLLSWLAEAQRVAGIGVSLEDRCLATIINRCAQILCDMRLRLSPLTLYSGRLRA